MPTKAAGRGPMREPGAACPRGRSRSIRRHAPGAPGDRGAARGRLAGLEPLLQEIHRLAGDCGGGHANLANLHPRVFGEPQDLGDLAQRQPVENDGSAGPMLFQEDTEIAVGRRVPDQLVVDARGRRSHHLLQLVYDPLALLQVRRRLQIRVALAGPYLAQQPVVQPGQARSRGRQPVKALPA